ncbi:MAG TPA: prepilin-type N-terminal cleavage/methylation domain-containing protein [Sulfurovum sp.]|nr:prepilin-type N-terminal cleavage/methylation domain-containing protein [Sulfurovum sp.]
MKSTILRPAFTLIEILISVLILSGSIVYALKIHSQNHELIVYITQRSKLSLQDSLFLADDVSRYHKDTKEAYDVINRYFRVDDLKSRKILKEISREYTIPEPISLTAEEEEGTPSAVIEEIKIKDKFSSSYFHFKINSF